MNIEATGKMILARRKEIGITQQQLGEKLGVTNTAVSKWERGLSYPDVTLLPSIAKELNLTISEILCGSLDNEAEQIESDTVANEVISLADKQIKKTGKKLKKIIIAFSVILTIAVLSFAIFIGVMSSSYFDATKWQTEITAQSYFDENCRYTLPIKARIGNPNAYYGKSFIVIKDIKNRKNILSKIEDYVRNNGDEAVSLSSGGFLIIDKENIGNGYVFTYDRPERSRNIYFYSAGVMLKKT